MSGPRAASSRRRVVAERAVVSRSKLEKEKYSNDHNLVYIINEKLVSDILSPLLVLQIIHLAPCGFESFKRPLYSLFQRVIL